MLVLYAEDGSVVLAHEKRGIILAYPIKPADLESTAFMFSDGTTAQFNLNEDIPELTVIKKGDSFISAKKDVLEFDSDVLYMGMNVKWLVCGNITFRSSQWD